MLVFTERVVYTEGDKVLLKYIASYFVNEGDSIMTRELESKDFYSEASINKLRSLKLIRYSSSDSIQIYPQIVTEKERLEELPDHFQTLKKWWYSKKWAVAFTVIFLILPALKTYIDLINTLFK
ncbi:hypothetical protein D4741_10020 [Pseudoalteromonas gelatinilytica]|uniref:Uncharacterized protein n=1 Tax=Pseudoalteromonas gelatinilytica TaxID=1703256 RepID=A0A3A3EI32_9GAMM|nr:hypothetical protein D4741_10020 [Pseudoalteromonas profundi]